MKKRKNDIPDSEPSPNNKMIYTKKEEGNKRFSDFEAPTLMQFLWVIIVLVLLIVFSWISYNQFGWFH